MWIAMAFVAAVGVAGCREAAGREARYAVPGGDADRGKAAIALYGCGSCHTIPGISGATGRVGPPLNGIATRTYVAGMLQNTPANLERWIENPQSVVPNNAMPNLGLSHQDAIDIAGYLYTLR